MEKTIIGSDSRKAMKYRGAECLNCGNPLELQDRYCSYCGQLNSTKRISLLDYFSEFVGSFFSFDSRFWVTVINLLFKPGRVTWEFTRGKRLKYANPFRFFLSISIVYFLLSNLLNFISPSYENNFDQLKSGWESSYDGSTKEEKAVTLDSLFRLAQSEAQDTVIEARKTYDYIPADSVAQMDFFERHEEKFNLFRGFREATEIKNANLALDSLRYPSTRFNIWLYNRAELPQRIRDRPIAFARYILDKIPFFIFFFTPVFALFFLLIYWKRIPVRVLKWKIDRIPLAIPTNLADAARPVTRSLKWMSARLVWLVRVRRPYTYMEHVIFLFHLFTFIFIGLLLCLLPDLLLGEDYLAGIFIMIICPFYFYKALRNFYKERRLRTVAKYLLLNVCFVMFASVGAALFVLITAATY